MVLTSFQRSGETASAACGSNCAVLRAVLGTTEQWPLWYGRIYRVLTARHLWDAVHGTACGAHQSMVLRGMALSGTLRYSHGTQRVITPALVACLSDGRMFNHVLPRSCHAVLRERVLCVAWDISLRGSLLHS